LARGRRERDKDVQQLTESKLVLPALAPTRRRRRIGFAVAGALSLLLHAGSLCAFLAWPGDPEIGALERPSDAISVELVANRTLEAMQPRQSSEPAPSPEATAPVEGKTEASDAAPLPPQPKQAREPEIKVPQPPVVIPDATEEVMRSVKQETPAVSEAPPLPVDGPAEVAPPPPKSGVNEDNAPAKRKQQKQPEKKKAAEPAPKGGVVSKSAAGKGKGGERASASSGSILSYAAHVRARVAGNKPSGGGLRGTAVVSFGVTPSGGLAYASVGRSSGSSQLDQLAVAAVRGAAPFPTPPAGAAPGQLRFSIPFHFQ
jgi:periplasmic protein TonB